jgi:hypothetical protein
VPVNNLTGKNSQPSPSWRRLNLESARPTPFPTMRTSCIPTGIATRSASHHGSEWSSFDRRPIPLAPGRTLARRAAQKSAKPASARRARWVLRGHRGGRGSGGRRPRQPRRAEEASEIEVVRLMHSPARRRPLRRHGDHGRSRPELPVVAWRGKRAVAGSPADGGS